jgi:hypothetical protein
MSEHAKSMPLKLLWDEIDSLVEAIAAAKSHDELDGIMRQRDLVITDFRQRGYHIEAWTVLDRTDHAKNERLKRWIDSNVD